MPSKPNEELKNCPFCGSEAVMKSPHGEYLVQCSKLGDCMGKHDMTREGYIFKRDAIERWNIRSPSAEPNTPNKPTLLPLNFQEVLDSVHGEFLSEEYYKPKAIVKYICAKFAQQKERELPTEGEGQ